MAFLIGYLLHKANTARTIGDAEGQARRITDDAKRLVDQATREAEGKRLEAEGKIRGAELEAKELSLRVRADLDQEIRSRQKEVQDVERRTAQKDEQLARQLDQLERREATSRCGTGGCWSASGRSPTPRPAWPTPWASTGASWRPSPG